MVGDNATSDFRSEPMVMASGSGSARYVPRAVHDSHSTTDLVVSSTGTQDLTETAQRQESTSWACIDRTERIVADDVVHRAIHDLVKRTGVRTQELDLHRTTSELFCQPAEVRVRDVGHNKTGIRLPVQQVHQPVRRTAAPASDLQHHLAGE